MVRQARAGVRAWSVPLALAVWAWASTDAFAQSAPASPSPADDPHLASVPLTAEEAARAAAALAPPEDFTAPQPFEALSGGATSWRGVADEDAFSHPSANLSDAGGLDFELGKALFDKLWVAAPASTRASDGLGPLYNARACQDCHLRDGRGRLPDAEGLNLPGLVLRLSLPAPAGAEGAGAIEGYLAGLPDPAYGRQLQDHAAPGLAAEGRIAVNWTETPVRLADGMTVTLRAPAYGIEGPAPGALSPDLRMSPRLAPPMIGLGLLEAIPAAAILAREDPDDRDSDGISGRANIVLSLEHDVPMLGRFGLKAGVATVREQAARALSLDMGLSSPLVPVAWGDCTPAQAVCRQAPDGEDAGLRDGRELDARGLDLIAFYARNLAVPARRGADDPAVLRGKALFHQSGCAACHQPNHVTARLPDRPEQSFQLIWPYTDLLLHDMGEGLADDVPEGRATGSEWRTPPLWGVGLVAKVGGQAHYLHDGRARSLLEAVLWHGGEALASRDRVVDMPKKDRDALISYLESL